MVTPSTTVTPLKLRKANKKEEEGITRACFSSTEKEGMLSGCYKDSPNVCVTSPDNYHLSTMHDACMHAPTVGSTQAPSVRPSAFGVLRSTPTKLAADLFVAWRS